MIKLNARELRDVPEEGIEKKLTHLKRIPLYFVLENVYDTYNVGGLFRLADALGVSHIYLSGEMETPPNHKIKKASIGTYKVVPWSYKSSAKEAIDELRINPELRVLAIEQDSTSIPYTSASYTLPLALVVGNETAGVTAETLSLVDHIVEIPMWGINRSLNVIVSAAIVSYFGMTKISR